MLHDMRPAEMRAFHAAAPPVPASAQTGFLPGSDGRPQAPRLFYPYSVVPGGVAGVAELKAAIARDPVVAAHYAGFNLGKARVTHSDRERLVYVSYRRGSRLYWTSHRLKLPKGEKLITDGVITARSRCGNQVSDTPSAQTSPEEPSAQMLDTPQPPETSSIWVSNPDRFNVADWGSDLTTIWQPPASSDDPADPGPVNLPLFFPPAAGAPMPTSTNPPPAPVPGVPVPEPSSLALLLTGLPAIWRSASASGRGATPTNPPFPALFLTSFGCAV
jgi:hypothetical protein